MITPPIDVYRASNPFRSSNIRPGANEFLFAEGQSVEQLYERLQELPFAQIVGPHGSGKSTLLVALAEYLFDQGTDVVRHVFDARTWEPSRQSKAIGRLQSELVSPPAVVMVDGFEQLSSWRRSRFIRRFRLLGKKLIDTTHRDLGAPSLYQTTATIEVASRVIDSICLRERVPNVVSDTDLTRLWKAHDGNIRELLFALYDEYQCNFAAA